MTHAVAMNDLSGRSTSPQPAATDAVPHYIQTIRDLQAKVSSTTTPVPTAATHFLALMKKNILLKLRAPISTICEIILPVLFSLLLVVVWAVSSRGDIPAEQYVTPATPPDFSAMVRDALCVQTDRGAPPVDGIQDCNATVARLQCSDNPILPVKGLCATRPPSEVYEPFLEFRAPRRFPSLDTLVAMQWLFTLDNDIGNDDGPSEQLAAQGFIYFTPVNAATRGLVEHFNTTSKLFKYISRGPSENPSPSAAALEAHIKSDTFDRSVTGTMAIVTVTGWDADNFHIEYSFNRTSTPETSKKEVLYVNGLSTYDGPKYLASGFGTVHTMVAQRYAQEFGIGANATGATSWLNTTDSAIAFTAMPNSAYTESQFLNTVTFLAPLLLAFGYLFLVSQLTKRIVEEKELRTREAMKIMGLSTASFYASWLVTYFVIVLLGSVIISVVLYLTVVPKANFAIVFFLFLFFAMSNVTLGTLISCFFSSSRVAALVAPVLFFAMAIPSFAIPANSSPGLLLALSWMSPSAFARGGKLLFEFEKTVGISNENFAKGSYPMLVVLILLAVDCIVYLLLTLYLDAIMPSEWGVPTHPCFCFLYSWCPWIKSGEHNRGFDENGNVRDGRDPNGAYEEIDRAGAEPSVQLFGLRKEFSTPAGTMTAVNDLTLDMYEGEITVLLGHNGAGKTTAMNLMTGMLGMSAGECVVYGAGVHDDVAAARQHIGMCPQHNILWDDLTCREHLEFFARIKGITGEDLDEMVTAMLAAVDLSDKAEVKSAGLSGGQKRKLSVGIAFVGGSKMVFLDEPTAGMDVAARRFTWDLIKHMSHGRTILLTTHFMDEADLLGNTVSIMSQGRLKCSGSSLFLKSRLGVGYTLSMACEQGTNPAKLASTVQAHVPTATILTSSGGELTMQLPVAAVPSFPALLSALETGGPSLGVRSHGISLTTLEEVFLKIGEEEAEAEDAKDSKDMLVEDGAAVNVKDNRDAWKDAAQHCGQGTWWTQPRALLMKRFHFAKRDRRTQVLQIALPVVCTLLAMLLALISFGNFPDLALRPSEFGTTQLALAGCPAEFAQYRGGVALDPVPASVSGTTQLSQYLLDTIKTHGVDDHRLVGIACGASPTLLNNETGWPHSLALALQTNAELSLQTAAGRAIDVSASLTPLPMSHHEKVQADSFRALMIGIIIMIPFSFIPSTFVAFIVKERECKAKHLQTVCGLHYITYWVCNFVFDLACFLITTTLAVLIFLAFSRSEYVGDASKFFATFVLFTLYGVAGVAGSYLCSFLFSSHATAQNVAMMVNFVMGFVLVIAAYFLTIIPGTKSFGEAISFVFRLWPSFCLGNGILNLASGGVFVPGGAARSPWHLDVTGWNMIFLALEAPLFFALTLLIDHPTLLKTVQSFGTEAEPQPIDNEDEDVLAEREAVESGARDDDLIVVKNFRKLYKTHLGTKLAVKNLSFAVRPGEVFGFLGTNGAGKTTSMSMLCGEFLPTSGHGFVAGHNVVTHGDEVRRQLGYCPQFDALLELLTVEEHMELYAGLRGLCGDAKDAIVEGLITHCGLHPHREKQTRALSGGNKRKLSVALALIGGPKVVFLDEPSAGMDPMARHGLWEVLEEVGKHCCIVLTTHHLEEVEALATRVAIMDQGELKCLGSLQHLKAKFGSGFEMSLRASAERHVPALRAFVSREIPAAELQEERNGKLTYALPPASKLSSVFALLERSKEPLHVTDYSVSQTSLESVFLKISEQGREAAEQQAAEHPAMLSEPLASE